MAEPARTTPVLADIGVEGQRMVQVMSPPGGTDIMDGMSSTGTEWVTIVSDEKLPGRPGPAAAVRA
ncbi:hypothetical protein GCM10009678_68690 [Actinomadura kijaniata]